MSHDLSHQPKYIILELKIGGVIITREYLIWFICGLEVAIHCWDRSWLYSYDHYTAIWKPGFNNKIVPLDKCIKQLDVAQTKMTSLGVISFKYCRLYCLKYIIVAYFYLYLDSRSTNLFDSLRQFECLHWWLNRDRRTIKSQKCFKI